MAGSKSLTELHGTNWTVKCLSCGGWTSPRSEFQQMLRAANPEYVEAVEKAVEVGGRSGVIRPDGDVDLPKVSIQSLTLKLAAFVKVQFFQDLVDSFTVPKCPRCRDGILMPDVVFFGDNVPKPRVDKVKEELRGGIHQSLLRLYS
jgi:NAD-dependent deacetylase sirtuin 4